jgi:hypothetical protein
MGFRVRKSFKVAPGVRLNVNKRSVSGTVGPRGAKITAGTRGARGTVGVPGTGMYYTEEHRWKTDAQPSKAHQSALSAVPVRHGSYGIVSVLAGLVVAAVAALIAGSGVVFFIAFLLTSATIYWVGNRSASDSVAAQPDEGSDQRIAKPKPQDIVAYTHQIGPIFPELTVAGEHVRRSVADPDAAAFSDHNATREKELRLALQAYKWILFTVEAVLPADRVLQSIHELMLSTARDYVLATEMALDSITPLDVEKRRASNAILTRASETLGQWSKAIEAL